MASPYKSGNGELAKGKKKVKLAPRKRGSARKPAIDHGSR